jgi:CRISPR-associated protein Cas1
MTGLDASLGFLHEHQPATPPLVYDFEEPYRWLVDHTVLKIILERRFSWDDFCFSGHYELRIDRLLLDRLMDLLRGQFNSGVVYQDKRLIWDTFIFRKCQELARYLLSKAARFELMSPRPVLDRSDSREQREKILGLSQSEARKLRIGKSTLHYLRKNAESDLSLKVYSKVQQELYPRNFAGVSSGAVRT